MKGAHLHLVFVVGTTLGLTAGGCATSDSSPFDGGTGTSTGNSTSIFSTSSGSSFSISLGGTTGATSAQSSTSVSSNVGDSGASDGSAGDGATSDASSGSSSGSSGSSSASGSSSGSSSASSSGSGSSAGSCYKAPTALHPETTAGVYCPFATASGAGTTCPATQHCCEPPTAAGDLSTCEPAATSCTVTGSTDWVCQGALDCAGTTGTICCGTGTIATQAAQPSCGDGGIPAYPYVSGFTGSSCKASCGTYQICSESSECPTATPTCVAIEPKGGPIGYCK